MFRSLYPPVRRREMSLSSHVHCIKHALLSSTGTIGDSSQGNACENNVELRIVSRPSCDLKCDVGYEPSSSVLTCSSDAVNGVTTAQTNLICNEYTCSAITYPVGTMSGNCEDPLTSVSSTSCELSCIPGYSGTYYLFLSHPLTSEYSLLVSLTHKLPNSHYLKNIPLECYARTQVHRWYLIVTALEIWIELQVWTRTTVRRIVVRLTSCPRTSHRTVRVLVLFCSIYIHFT